MRSRVGSLALVIAFTLLALRPPTAAAIDAETLPVGSAAPQFSAEDADGKPFVLAEALKEKPVMLVFFSLFCGSCMEELPIIEQEKSKFEDKVQILAVNLDEANRARSLKPAAKAKGFPTVRILLNKVEKKAEDGSVVKKEFQIDTAYKIRATPALYLINRDGTIAYGHYGPLNPDELAAVVAQAR
ncbi:MAG TPA: TlpA disulfide reductase family protein [bacterium]